MAQPRAPRIAELYIDTRWNPAPAGIRLDVPTANALRDEGITMVRVSPSRARSLWRYFTGRPATTGRDVSICRYLAARGQSVTH